MNHYAYGRKRPPLLSIFLMMALFCSIWTKNAQAQTNNQYQLTLQDAVAFAKNQNKWIQAAHIEAQAVNEDRKDAYNAALPTINVSGSYQRFSGLTLFTDGLSNATTGPRKPSSNSAALGVDALFNIYSGGRQKALQKEQTLRLNLANINTQDQSGNIAMQTANQYLELVKLFDLQRFIQDQLTRAQTRLDNTNSLYKNQKVTRSDLLRVEVSLANVQLSLQENENNIGIANRKLDVLLNVPDSVKIFTIDAASMAKPEIASLLPFVQSAGVSSYAIQKATENVAIQKEHLKGIQSGNKPSLSFYTAYGINYPNYLFFPPVDQAYSIGFVGLKAQYSISSLYHNKSKVAAAKLRVKELQVQQEAYTDNVRAEVEAYYIKYAESLTRIAVNEHSVAQAELNYRIVNTKYINQLSLLTDLLDADNLYQESQFNLVKAQTDAFSIYYRILYISGNL